MATFGEALAAGREIKTAAADVLVSREEVVMVVGGWEESGSRAGGGSGSDPSVFKRGRDFGV